MKIFVVGVASWLGFIMLGIAAFVIMAELMTWMTR